MNSLESRQIQALRPNLESFAAKPTFNPVAEHSFVEKLEILKPYLKDGVPELDLCTSLPEMIHESQDKSSMDQSVGDLEYRADVFLAELKSKGLLHQRTIDHSKRVACLAKVIANRLGWENTELKILKEVARVHDVGKHLLCEKLLDKTGQLTGDEAWALSMHPELGARLLWSQSELQILAPGVLAHHMNPDGSGYPQLGLEAEAIPGEARIVHVVDNLHALMENRPWRNGISRDDAIAHTNGASGRKFDTVIVSALEKLPQHLLVA